MGRIIADETVTDKGILYRTASQYPVRLEWDSYSEYQWARLGYKLTKKQVRRDLTLTYMEVMIERYRLDLLCISVAGETSLGLGCTMTGKSGWTVQAGLLSAVGSRIGRWKLPGGVELVVEPEAWDGECERVEEY